MKFNNREDIIALTPKWTGERLPDGRPKVPDKYLDALYGMTLEELWHREDRMRTQRKETEHEKCKN